MLLLSAIDDKKSYDLSIFQSMVPILPILLIRLKYEKLERNTSLFLNSVCCSALNRKTEVAKNVVTVPEVLKKRLPRLNIKIKLNNLINS